MLLLFLTVCILRKKGKSFFLVRENVFFHGERGKKKENFWFFCLTYPHPSAHIIVDKVDNFVHNFIYKAFAWCTTKEGNGDKIGTVKKIRYSSGEVLFFLLRKKRRGDFFVLATLAFSVFSAFSTFSAFSFSACSFSAFSACSKHFL